MKKVINWFRDLFYRLTDYTLIICVVVIVAGILIWRLNILFNLKADKEAITNNVPPISIDDNSTDVSSNPNDSSNTKNTNDTDYNVEDSTSNDSTTDQNSDNASDDNESKDNNKTQTTPGQKIKINIPAGSFPSQIADILIKNGLISDKDKFLLRSTELAVDTKLKAGDFIIESGTDIDTILGILSK